jgi:phage-related protein (TIGR01555 family)
MGILMKKQRHNQKAKEKKIDGAIYNRALNLGFRDFNSHGQFKDTKLRSEYRDAIFENSLIMRRIISALPFFSVKEGVDVKTGNESKDSEIEKWMNTEDVLGMIQDSWVDARVHGGSAIWMFKEGDNETFGDFSSLVQLSKDEISQGSSGVVESPVRDDFGYPAEWDIHPARTTSSGFRVSSERVIRFEGLPVRRDRAQFYDYFGKSYLESIYEQVLIWVQSNQQTSQILADFTKDILKTNLIAQLQATEASGEVTFDKRLALLSMTKNNRSTIAIDKEGEEYSVISKQISGLDKVFEKLDDTLVIETGIPKLILLGRSPSGLQTNGNSEMQFFLDQVKHQQVRYLEPKLRKIIKAKFGIEDFSFEWRPLDKPGLKDETEARKMQAEIDQIYITNQVLDPETVAEKRFGGDKYSHETQLSKEELSVLKMELTENMEGEDNENQDQPNER